MSRVPNLSGLSTSAAITSIQTAGLVASSTGTVNTGDSGLNGKIASQSPASNTLVNYESTVSYTSYVYVAPTCTPGWQFTSYGDWSDYSVCSGGTQTRYRAVNGYYLYSDCSTGSIQQYDTQSDSRSCYVVGAPCTLSYACSQVGCSFCCPDTCYRAGTINSSGTCANPSGSYFC